MEELNLGTVRELSVGQVENGLVHVPGDHDGETVIVAVVESGQELVEKNDFVKGCPSD
jgi:hypothetical protein